MEWLNLSHVLSGANDRSREIRDEETKRADRAFELERRSLEWLAQSDDPKIRTAAITGILSQSQPKKKGGLSGWFGEVEKHPAFESISRMVNTPVMKQRTKRFATPEGGKPMYSMGSEGATGPMVDNPEFAGSEGGGGRMAALTGGGPGAPSYASIPPDMATTDGPEPYRAERPPRPQGPPAAGFGAMHEQFGGNRLTGDTGPAPKSRPQPGHVPYDTGSMQESYMAPRDVFYSDEEKIRRNYSAQYGGRLQGIIQGAREAGVELSPDEIEEIVMAQSGSPSRRNRYGAKQVQFRDGTTGVVSYNQATGGWQDGSGNPVDDSEIAKFLPTGGGSGTRSFQQVIKTPQGLRRVITTVDNSTGETIHQQDVGEGVPPPAAVVQAVEGTFQVPRTPGEAATQVPNVTPRPTGRGAIDRLDPRLKEKTRQLEKDASEVAEVYKAGSKLGSLTSPTRGLKAADAAAQVRGYENYEDLLGQLEAAREAVTAPSGAAGGVAGAPGGVPPPSTPAPPAAPTAPAQAPVAPPPDAGGFGTPQGADAIRRHLPVR